MSFYADVILPVPLYQYFTYRVPAFLEYKLIPGHRVYVPFGKKDRRVTAIVVKVHENEPRQTGKNGIKEIHSLLDPEQRPSILPLGLKLAGWISDYYISAPGDTIKAMLPSGLRPDSNGNEVPFKPRMETFVKLSDKCAGKSLEEILTELPRRAEKQRLAVEKYMELAGISQGTLLACPVAKRTLASMVSAASALKSLEENGIFEFYSLETGRLPEFTGNVVQPSALSPLQQTALEQIQEQFKTKNVALLHGVTACGKTEIYIHLIKQQLEQGRQVLFMLPEIALTTQIKHRLQRVFGSDMCVYHSQCNDNIRVEVWNKQCSDNPYKLVLGARSSVMLPFRNLGLVIVDEEHEPSYKQEDPSPRYHGRNTAIMLAAMSGAKTLLGSATPSIESYYNAITGKYGLVTLSERFSKVEQPEIETIDVADLRKRKYMKGIFSPPLVNGIEDSIRNHNQVILFHNRRGYSNMVSCPTCGWVQKCNCCDVSLTYHKSSGKGVCHYCGQRFITPAVCPECGCTELKGTGYGTEKLEETVRKIFPDARIARLDLDAAKGNFEDIISDFQEQKTDILIGTQMVSKGLDFGKVNLVGVIQADSIMSYPDFRSSERAFQLMIQVAGRAGRRDTRGKVMLQTLRPEEPLLQMIRANDYKAFAESTLKERQLFGYPPFSRMTSINIRHRDSLVADRASLFLADKLAEKFGRQYILGPDAPAVSRIQLLYIRKILIKTPLNVPVARTRSLILEACRAMENEPGLTGVTLSFDVDPQ